MDSAFVGDIKKFIKSEIGIDLDKPINKGDETPKTPTYDNGGVLQGLGGIKATSADEIVLGPKLTSKILSPVSNERFDSFVKDMGILFGASSSAPREGKMVLNGGNHTDSHDHHYSINGIPVSTEAASRYTISELFQNMSLFSD
jgi:hypothetical protein